MSLCFIEIFINLSVKTTAGQNISSVYSMNILSLMIRSFNVSQLYLHTFSYKYFWPHRNVFHEGSVWHQSSSFNREEWRDVSSFCHIGVLTLIQNSIMSCIIWTGVHSRHLLLCVMWVFLSLIFVLCVIVSSDDKRLLNLTKSPEWRYTPVRIMLFCVCTFRFLLCFRFKRRSSFCCLETKLTPAYSSKAAKTNSRHTAIQMSIAFT